MQTQDLTIDVDGSPMPSYLARPDGNEPKPAVIVLQEIFGVNAEVKRIADLFASAGYVALAINYYHRTHPNLNEPYTQEGLQVGFAAAGAVSRATLRADVAAAIAWLDGQPFVAHGKIATVGFCFGGSTAFVTATLPGLKAAIPFYGGSIAAGFPNGEPEGLAKIGERLELRLRRIRAHRPEPDGRREERARLSRPWLHRHGRPIRRGRGSGGGARL